MSTPLKHYSSNERFTPSTNNRSSTADFASPQTAFTNYTPELVRNAKGELDALMTGLNLNTHARHALDDPFIDQGARVPSKVLSATAVDYAPVTATAPLASSPHSFAYSSTRSSPPLAGPLADRVAKTSAINVANLIPVETTRYVKIAGPIEDDAGMTRIKDVKTMEKSVATKKLDEGGLIFRFDNIKDAQIALNTTSTLFKLGSFMPGWTAKFAPAADFHGDHSRDYEGQLKVAINYTGQGHCAEGSLHDIALATIQDLVGSSVDILSSTVKSFDVEKRLLLLDTQLGSVQAAELLANKYGREWKTLPENKDIDIYIEHNCSKFPLSSKPWVSSHSALALRAGHGSPISPYSPGIYLSPNAKDAKVNISAIENGEDVRTTVMIRNIPNKIDAAMFKTILDEHVFGRYDFSYLRIDFTNNCNVGYAFVNFKNPRDIITLFKGIVDKPWQVFSSDKIADVCYATNQGLGTCIEKFRNSSVMLEWAPHRPKLWYTFEDGEDVAGTEKPFPEPSNLQKLHRSRANANSIGLFPPRGVQISSLGLSPTRASHGGMTGNGWQCAYGQQAMNGTPPMMLMSPQRHNPEFGSNYGQGIRPVSGGYNTMFDAGHGHANTAFMPGMPFGYVGNGTPPRF